jgi:hypothetical protein
VVRAAVASRDTVRTASAPSSATARPAGAREAAALADADKVPVGVATTAGTCVPTTPSAADPRAAATRRGDPDPAIPTHASPATRDVRRGEPVPAQPSDVDPPTARPTAADR